MSLVYPRALSTFLMELVSGNAMIACFLHKAVQIKPNQFSALELAQRCFLCPEAHFTQSFLSERQLCISVCGHTTFRPLQSYKEIRTHKDVQVTQYHILIMGHTKESQNQRQRFVFLQSLWHILMFVIDSLIIRSNLFFIWKYGSELKEITRGLKLVLKLCILIGDRFQSSVVRLHFRFSVLFLEKKSCPDFIHKAAQTGKMYKKNTFSSWAMSVLLQCLRVI